MSVEAVQIHCPSCGGNAHFDIRKQIYQCSYCGGNVTIDEALEEKRGFRQMAQEKLKSDAGKYRLSQARCPGCGARLVFEENEALTKCSFCNKALVRKDYIHTDNLPELLIPFRLTPDEAKDRLLTWCRDNRGKKEAIELQKKADELKGVYLPYEVIRGPVACKAYRLDGGRKYDCGGFVDKIFINCSRQLDNRLLDGMEPFDLDGITEFDFSRLAGHHVKIADIDQKELTKRVSQEVGEGYKPTVRKTLEAKAVQVDADVSDTLRMPALLPVYYYSSGDLMAAINGQTGKVSVRALNDSHYYFLPWWLKAILATILFTLVSFAGLSLFNMELSTALVSTAALSFFFLIVSLAAYSDSDKTSFCVKSEKKIYTSGNEVYTRENGDLIREEKELERTFAKPVFFEKIDGKVQAVKLRFTSPFRLVKVLLLAFGVLFLPVIIALFLNGFDFARLNLAGSAVWFCIFVPVIPIYILKFERIELYERPWIYLIREDGSVKRFRKRQLPKVDIHDILAFLKVVFIPPISLAVWFGILCFFAMCYFTAFGFD